MPTYENLPAESKHFNGKLFQKMVDDLRLAGKAKRTVYGYLRAVRKLADFCETAPEQLAEHHVREYLLYLIVEREVATGTQSVALSGIKFFYRQTFPNWLNGDTAFWRELTAPPGKCCVPIVAS